MNPLDKLLSDDAPMLQPKREVAGPLSRLSITREALEKAYAYARIVNEVSRDARMECGGYLTALAGAEGILATDAFLAKDQDVRSGLFTVHPPDVIRAGREIAERGHRVLGWWHSHGSLPTFFSETDDHGQLTVLNEIAASNYIAFDEETRLDDLVVRREGGRLIAWEARNPRRKYAFDVSDGSSIRAMSFLQERRVGFAYGLVVNNNGNERQPYAEIARRQLCYFCRESRDESRVVPVDVVDAPFRLDMDTLRKDVLERVKYRGWWGNPKTEEVPVENQGLFGWLISQSSKRPANAGQGRFPPTPVKKEDKPIGTKGSAGKR